MKSNRLLCILLSVFCTLLLFAGCGSSDSQGWNVQNDSLLNFPWGCTVEDAQSFLGLSDADLVDKGDFSAPEQAGNDHRYVTYQLPEGHAYPFDYLMLTDEQYTDSSGKIYPVGITTITMGYTEYRIENGERIELEIPQKKLDHLEKTFHQQVKRCKDSYTANILGYDGKTYPTPAWRRVDRGKMGKPWLLPQ